MILNIIKAQCLPRQSCMLSVINDKGETGFLYFQESQLIEVNCGSIWGQDAFQTILLWSIVKHSVGELPSGIKRTIWQPWEEIVQTAQQKTPTLNLHERAQQCMKIEGFLALYEKMNDQLRLVEGNDIKADVWYDAFKQKGAELERVLNAGSLKNFSVLTPDFQAWALEAEGRHFLIAAKPNADFFESQMRKAIGI